MSSDPQPPPQPPPHGSGAHEPWWRRLLGAGGGSDQAQYVRIAVIALVALYVVGFIVANSKSVSISLVLGSISLPLLWLVIVCLILGAVAGWSLRGMRERRRAP